MFGERLAIERDVLFLHERNHVAAEQREHLRGTHGGEPFVDGIGVDGVGRVAHQAEHDAAIGAVALAGRAERAVQLHLDRRGAVEQAVTLEPLGEQQRRAHRPDGVRAGRTDADFEEIEDADCHDCSCKKQ